MRGRAKRAFGSAMVIASVVAMTALASSGTKPDVQAAPTQSPASSSPASSSPASSSPASSSPTNEFVSDRYDFAVTLPQTWTEVDATVDWTGKYISGPGSPLFANFTDDTGTRTLMGAAATVPTGTQLADFQATIEHGTPPECSSTSSPETTTIDGEPALIWTVKCTDGLDAIHLVALHGDRGYVVYMGSATMNDDAEDRRIFDGIRQSFRFTGDSVPDTSSAASA